MRTEPVTQRATGEHSRHGGLDRTRRCIEIGTFAGYSSTAVALRLPAGGRMVCCDVSEEWTSVRTEVLAPRLGVTDKIDLADRTSVARRSTGCLQTVARGRTTLAFVDADQRGYDGYYERLLRLVRTGGVIAFDNTLSGEVLDPRPAGRGQPAPSRRSNRKLGRRPTGSVSGLLPVARPE